MATQEVSVTFECWLGGGVCVSLLYCFCLIGFVFSRVGMGSSELLVLLWVREYSYVVLRVFGFYFDVR